MINVNKNSYIGLIREELDGSYLCIPSAIGKPMFLNNTLYEIFKNCKGKSIEDVTNIMEHKYTDIPRLKLKNDVMTGIWALRNMGIISITGENMMKENIETDIFEMPNEWDYEKISNFIINIIRSERGFYFFDNNSLYKNAKYIDELFRVENLRFNHVMGKEIIYKYSELGSDEIDGIISFSISENRRVVYIKYLVAKSEDLSIKVIRCLHKVLCKNELHLSKVCISEVYIKNEFKAFLENCGYYLEAKLGEEAEIGDKNIFACALSENSF